MTQRFTVIDGGKVLTIDDDDAWHDDPLGIDELARFEFAEWPESIVGGRLERIDKAVDELKWLSVLAVEICGYSKRELVARVRSSPKGYGPLVRAINPMDERIEVLLAICEAARERVIIAQAVVERGGDEGAE